LVIDKIDLQVKETWKVRTLLNGISTSLLLLHPPFTYIVSIIGTFYVLGIKVIEIN